MKDNQRDIARLKAEKEASLPTPGVFGGGDFGSGAGGRFDLYPDYSDRTTFNEAFDAAYEDALSQGIRPEDYIFMYGEKPYKAEKTNNPLREVDNRLVGNSNRRSKLKREDNYQHMTMGIPGSGLQFAQGGLMGNLFIAGGPQGSDRDYNLKRGAYGNALQRAAIGAMARRLRGEQVRDYINDFQYVITPDTAATYGLSPTSFNFPGFKYDEPLDTTLPELVVTGTIPQSDKEYIGENLPELEVLGSRPKQKNIVYTASDLPELEVVGRKLDKSSIDSGGRNQRTVSVTSKKKIDGKPIINDPSAYKTVQVSKDALWVPGESTPATPTPKTGGKTGGKTPTVRRNTNSTPTAPAQTGTPAVTTPEDPYRRYRLDTTPGNKSRDAVLKNAMWRLENQNLPGLAASIPSHIDPKEKIKSPVSPTAGFDTDSREYPTWMRYIPALGAGIGVATDALGLTNKPDYTYADKIEGAAESAGYTPNVQFAPIGNYMRYNPMDITYGLNQLAAQSRATDRGIQNTAGTRGAAMAGMLANGYNSQLAQGNMYRQALEYNDALQRQVEDFNRGTDQFNAQMGLEAAIANARYQQVARNARLSGLAQAAAMRDAIDQRVGAARSANLTNLFNSLGNIGRENFIFNQIESSKAANNGYSTTRRGSVTHAANGGSINKGRKRGGAR